MQQNRIAHTIDDSILEVSEMLFFSPTLFKVTLSSENVLPPIKPGQFVQVQIHNNRDVFLRRPLSIYSYTEHSITLLIQVIGKGTASLAQTKIGDKWQVLLPLGNGFSIDTVGDHPILIGGGVGVAPLFALGHSLKEKGIVPTFLLGARTVSHFPDLSDFSTIGTLYTTTQDGSSGEKGVVTNHSVLEKGNHTEVYTCGPTPMMKAVALWSYQNKLPCFASLENMMACGMGVCLCCVEPTVKGHQSVCNDGPVFKTSELLWNN